MQQSVGVESRESVGLSMIWLFCLSTSGRVKIWIQTYAILFISYSYLYALFFVG